jgi:hypothetical protein
MFRNEAREKFGLGRRQLASATLGVPPYPYGLFGLAGPGRISIDR